MYAPSQALLMKPMRSSHPMGKGKKMKVSCLATSVPADDRVPDMGKRELMNLLLLGTISLPTAFMVVPYAAFFVPPGYVLAFPCILNSF
jgi:cytochrome b6-f complex iron-sulfur subunit